MKKQLDELITKYQVQPVGRGYIDCIVSYANVYNFIDELTNLGIRVYGLTWWCHTQSKNTDCPHGMGGPKSIYYDGWFSEMNFPLIIFDDNESALKYLQNPNDDDILQCFVPALWLDVPNSWKNIL